MDNLGRPSSPADMSVLDYMSVNPQKVKPTNEANAADLTAGSGVDELNIPFNLSPSDGQVGRANTSPSFNNNTNIPSSDLNTGEPTLEKYRNPQEATSDSQSRNTDSSLVDSGDKAGQPSMSSLVENLRAAFNSTLDESPPKSDPEQDKSSPVQDLSKIAETTANIPEPEKLTLQDLGKTLEQIKKELSLIISPQTEKANKATDRLATSISHIYINGSVINGDTRGNIEIQTGNMNTGNGIMNIADNGSNINNVDHTNGDVAINNGLSAGDISLLELNAKLEMAEQSVNEFTESIAAPEVPQSVKETGAIATDLAKDVIEKKRTTPTDDLSLDPETAGNNDKRKATSSTQVAPPPASQSAAADDTSKVPPVPAPAPAATDKSVELESSDQKPEDQTKKKAEELVGKLTPEETQELQAAEKKDGFLHSIKRAFTGGTWKRWIPGVVLSAASSFGMTHLAGVALASGPIGTALFGGAIVGMGIWGGIKTLSNLREVAKQEGKTIWQILGNKEALIGATIGAAVSGSMRGLNFLVPGIGSAVGGVAIEGATQFFAEKYLNKKQQELLDKYFDNYAARRYENLKDKGYVIRGADGTLGVSLETILKDMKGAPSEGEKKTAKKAAIAALKYLHAQTKDDKFKEIQYTVKENGKDVVKKVDLTTLALEDQEGSTDSYKTKDFNPNIEAYLDTIDIANLEALINEAWGRTDEAKRAGMAKDIVELFVGIEGADVDKVLSEERKQYLSVVHFTTGLHTAMGAINAGLAVYSGSTMLFEAPKMNFAGQNNSSPLENQQATNEFRTASGESNAEVQRTHTQNGHIVDAIDIEGNGTLDLAIDHTTGAVHIQSPEGAAQLFELQFPQNGEVVSSTFENPHAGGIIGTLSDSTGKVVGITFADSNGTIGVMQSSDLSSHFSVADTSGASHQFTLGDIQPNGDTILTVDGTSHNINLHNLETIKIEAAAGGVIGGSALEVQPGDSVNSLLHETMAQAKALNPGLAQYDDYQLERMMYNNGFETSDGAIRSETGMGNPIQTTELSGKTFDWAKSSTIMGWLTELNNNQPINLPTATSTPGTPGNNLNVNFTADQLLQVDMSDPARAGAGLIDLTPVGKIGLATFIGAAVAGALGMKGSKSQVGGITRDNTVTAGTSGKTDDKTDEKTEKATGIEKTTTVKSEQKESEKKIDMRKEVIVNQVLKNITKEKFIKIGEKPYIELADNPGHWLVKDGDINKLLTSEELADLLLALDEKQMSAELSQILQTAAKNGTKIKLELEDNKSEEYIKKSTMNPNKDSKPKFFIDWVDTTDNNKKLQSRDLAAKILALKEKTITLQAEPGDTPKPVEAKSDNEQSAPEKEKNIEFGKVAQNILNNLHTNGKKIRINGETYKYDETSNTWLSASWNPVAIFRNRANGEYLADQQVIKAWENAKNLESDLAYTLQQIEADSTVTLKERFTKIQTEIVGEFRIQTKKGELYEWDEAKQLYILKSKAGTAKQTLSQSEVDEMGDEVTELGYKGKSKIWSSKSEKLSDQQFAKKVAELRTDSDNAEPNPRGVEQKENISDPEAEAAKENREEESRARKWIKTALIVSGVVLGGATFVTGGSAIATAVAAATGIGSLLTGIFKEKFENDETKTQKADSKLLAKISEENRQATPEEQKQIEENKKKREKAQNIARALGLANSFLISFTASSGILGMLGFGLKHFNIDIKGSFDWMINKWQLSHTPISGTQPFGGNYSIP